jgi:hypothetical protein
MTDFETSDRDVNRAIRSWLREDRHEDVTRVAGAVLDQVDTIPQRRAMWWPARRTPTMNKIVGFGLAAAAVVAIALIGAQLIGSPDPGGTGAGTTSSPEPSVAEPTQEPTPEATPDGLPEGSQMILTGQSDDPSDPEFPPLTVTIPASGWYGEVGGGTLFKNNDYEPPDGAGMIVFVQQEYIVYGDACHWETTVPDAPVTTVDEFVAALSAQASRDASEPVDITLGGYAGKSITLEVPDDLDFTECDPGYGGSWDCNGDGMAPCGYHSGAGEIDTVYVLGLDGLIMAWNTNYYAGTPAEVVAELEAIVQSASFGE